MGFWDTLKRVGTAVATGGISEGYGYKTVNDAGLSVPGVSEVEGFLSDTYGNPDPVQLHANQADYAAAANEYNPYRDWLQAQQGYQIDPTQMNQSRGGLLSGVESYQGALANPQNSAAAQLQRQGLAGAQGQAAQLAASARVGPGASLLAQQTAQRQGAALALAGNNQAAQLQAQEMAAARAGLTQAAGQLYGADQQRAGLFAQQANANQAFQNQGRLAVAQGRGSILGQYASDQTNAQTTAAGINAQNQRDAAKRRGDAVGQLGQGVGALALF